MATEKRLIDANVLQKKFEGLKEKDAHATGRNAYDLCAMLTEDAPTVDAVEVVHGRWVNPYINSYGHPCHCCSECGFKASYQDKNFCPNCGAKMDGDGNGC